MKMENIMDENKYLTNGSLVNVIGEDKNDRMLENMRSLL
jgi:hypothetical protein